MDGLNWYTYCGGNPMGAVDPSGLLPVYANASNYGSPPGDRYSTGSDLSTQGARDSYLEGRIKKVIHETIKDLGKYIRSTNDNINETNGNICSIDDYITKTLIENCEKYLNTSSLDIIKTYVESKGYTAYFIFHNTLDHYTNDSKEIDRYKNEIINKAVLEDGSNILDLIRHNNGNNGNVDGYENQVMYDELRYLAEEISMMDKMGINVLIINQATPYDLKSVLNNKSSIFIYTSGHGDSIEGLVFQKSFSQKLNNPLSPQNIIYLSPSEIKYKIRNNIKIFVMANCYQKCLSEEWALKMPLTNIVMWSIAIDLSDMREKIIDNKNQQYSNLEVLIFEKIYKTIEREIK